MIDHLSPFAVLLLVAAAPSAEAQAGPSGPGPGVSVPESSLRLLLRSRDALALDSGQVLTLELKDAELEKRRRALLEERVDVSSSSGGPAAMAGGGMGPPLGGEGGAGGPRPPGDRAPVGAGRTDPNARRTFDDLEALDQAAIQSVRRIFRDEQRAKVDALLAWRAARLRPPESSPPPPEPPPRPAGDGSAQPARTEAP